MPLYECVFIARQDISSSQVEGLVGQFTGIIEENSGRVAKSEMWGLRNLAYRIKKNRKGHYAMLNLDAPAAAVQEMERNMRLNEDVIRYLTVRVSEIEEGPSVVMQAKHGREERGGRGGRGGGFRGDSRGGDFRGDRPPRGGPRSEGGPRGEESKPQAAGTEDKPKAAGAEDKPKTAEAAGAEDKPKAAEAANAEAASEKKETTE